MNWEIVIEPANKKVSQSVAEQLSTANWHFKTFNRIGDVIRNCWDCCFTVQSAVQQNLVRHASEHENGRLAVVVDKDAKRRAFMDYEGYTFRLMKGYLGDPSFYQHRPDMSKEDVAYIRNKLAHQFLPKHLARREAFNADNTQYAYHNYKGKCIGHEGGLICGKDHAHEREIVSDVSNPFRAHFKSIARAIRLIKYLSEEPTWTLWYQNDLKPSILSKIAKLKTCEKHVHKCKCGRDKHPINMAKFDASQFFKSADINRGVSRIHELLDRVQQKKKLAAVAVFRTCRMQGNLCSSRRKDEQHVKIIRFSAIKQALEFIKRDVFFAVGDNIVMRQRGWPMGGSLSEPSTLVDIQEEIRLRYSTEDVNGSLEHLLEGLSDLNMNFQDIIQGVQHVDDAAVFSKVLCTQCLGRVMEKLWPADVGVTMEEEGQIMRMLSGVIVIEGQIVRVFPYIPNFHFCLGLSENQKIAKLGSFIGPEIHSYDMLRSYIFSELLRFNAILQGDDMAAIIFIALIVREAAALGWPEKWISKALRSLPRKHTTNFVNLCRKVGKQLVHNSCISYFSTPLILCKQVLALPSVANYCAHLAAMGGGNWQQQGGWQPKGKGQSNRNQNSKGKGGKGDRNQYGIPPIHQNFRFPGEQWQGQQQRQEIVQQNVQGGMSQLIGWAQKKMEDEQQAEQNQHRKETVRAEIQESFTEVMRELMGAPPKQAEPVQEKSTSSSSSDKGYLAGGLQAMMQMFGAGKKKEEKKNDDKKKKDEKGKRKRSPSPSGSSDSDSDDSTQAGFPTDPDWLKAIKEAQKADLLEKMKKEKEKEKKKEKDKKEQKEKDKKEKKDDGKKEKR